MTVLVPDVPALDADPGQVRRCGTDLLVASARIDDLGTFVAGEARVPGWSGQAATAYDAALAPTGQRADAMSLALRAVAHRVDAHADALATLLERRLDLVEWRDHLLTVVAEPAVLQAQVDAYAAEVAVWVDDVETEEAAMVAAFTRVGTLEQVEQAYGGVADPADEALATKPDDDAGPAAVVAWWRGLTLEQRRAVIAASPEAIGGLDGVPATDRDAANRVSLGSDLAQLTALAAAGPLTPAQQKRLANARAAQDAVERIEGGVDPATGEPLTAQVYLYEPGAFGGDGAVAVAAGDLDTADNVSVTVPGFGTDAESAGYQADRATRLYEASRSLDPTQTNASMFWIGYDAPDDLPPDGLDAAGVTNEALATAGGDRLADTLDGLRESRPGEPTHLTAIGHSYGSTTLGHAASDHGVPVDDLAVVGSPGLGGDVDEASDLGVDPEHVWAGANSDDPVAYLADDGWAGLGTLDGLGLGHDPVEDDFGANRFEAEDPSGTGSLDFDQHSLYFDHDTESLHNLASVVNGDYGAVTAAEPVHDPWYGAPEDPEGERTPTSTGHLHRALSPPRPSSPTRRRFPRTSGETCACVTKQRHTSAGFPGWPGKPAARGR